MTLDADDIGKDIEAAIATVEKESPVAPAPGDAAPPSGETPPSTEPSEGERARDENGRFKAKEEKTEAPKAETPKAETPKAETKPATQPQTPTEPQIPTAERIAPPQHWKGTGKVDWNKLPRHVQEAINDDYKNFGNVQTQHTALQQAIAPYEQELRFNGPLEQGLRNTLAVASEARKNPTGFLLWFAQQNGINLAQMTQGAGQTQGQPQQMQQPQPVIPQPQDIQRLVAETVEQQTRKAIAQREIETFQNDPAHPYFNDVRQLMKALLESGQSATLQEAYDSACYAQPNIRQQLLAAQAEKERSEQAQRNSQTVAKAKAATGSLTGSPAGAQVPKDGPAPTLEDELRRQVERVLG